MLNKLLQKFHAYTPQLMAKRHDFVHETTLPNGIDIASQRRFISKRMEFSIRIDRGSMDEPADKSGAAHYMEHALLRAGSYRGFRERGGFLNARTGAEYIEIYGALSATEENIEYLLAQTADILTSVIDPASVEKERARIQNEIGKYRDTPDYNHYTMLHQVFARQAGSYGNLGSKESVASISAQDLEKLKREWFVGKNISVAVTGVTDHEQLFQKLDTALGAIPAGQGSPVFEPSLSPGDYREKNTALHQLYFGVYFPSPPLDARQALYAELADSYISEIVQKKMIEDEGMVYTAGVNRYTSPARNGYIGIGGNCLPEDAHRIMPAIAEILADASHSINPRAFERIRQRMIEDCRGGNYLFPFHYTSDMAFRKKVFGKVPTVHESEKMAADLRPEDVKFFIAWCLASKPTIVTYGDDSGMHNAEQFSALLAANQARKQEDKPASPQL